MRILGKRLPLFFFTFFAFNILTILILVLLLKKLPPEIPLFYGNPRGEQQLAPRAMIVVPSTISAGATLLNAAGTGYFKDRLIDGVLRVMVVILTVLSLITTFKIVEIVGNI